MTGKVATEGDVSPEAVRPPRLVVGIGASAGGLEAIERLFRAMPTDSGMAFVLIQHLSPDFKSLMKELVERFTAMPAVAVHDAAELRADTVYLLPPKKDMVVEGDRLLVHDRLPEAQLSLPIDRFFRSLAAAWGEKAVAIVLSGTGSDGSSGVRDIRDAGGMVLAQSEETARFGGMPRAAIATGCVDAERAPEGMPAALKAFSENRELGALLARPDGDDMADGMPAILESLRATYGTDFNYYKPATIARRIERRVALHPEYIDIGEYARLLRDDPSELERLYKDLLIGVTRFFRDPEAFAVLRQQIVSTLVDRLEPGEEVRVWVCGCSSGEEAYSMAILFLEAFEARQLEPRVKVLATDLHRESLRVAGEGEYAEASLSEMPGAMKEKYFIEQADGSYRVAARLRKVLIFSEHNLLKDPPFTRIDLVSCRNLLIYLEVAAQMRALAGFHFALKPQAYLLLGSSEGLGELAAEFGVVDRRWKLFQKLRDNRLLSECRLPLGYETGRTLPGMVAPDLRLGRPYEVVLSHFIPAGILVNERNEVLHVFGEASRYLRPMAGRASLDVLSMFDGHLRIAAMTALRNARQQKVSVTYRGILWQEGNELADLDLKIQPLPDKGGATYYMLQFEQAAGKRADAPAPRNFSVQAVGEERRDRVEMLEAELQRVRESLQSTVEELETSNEELQATNEEMLASNEELQSTNEELHSVNEELFSVNAEHELKIQELNAVTSDLRNLIHSTELATLFIDREYRIRLFTPLITAIFPILTQDIGRDLRHFTPQEPDPDLFRDLAAALEERSTTETLVSWRDGRNFLRRITPYQDTNKAFSGLVVTWVDMSEQMAAQEAQRRAEARYRALVEQSMVGVYLLQGAGFKYVNPRFAAIFGFDDPAAVVGRMGILDLVAPEDRERVAENVRRRLAGEVEAMNYGFTGLTRDGQSIQVEVFGNAIESEGRPAVLGVLQDVSERKRLEAELESHRQNLEQRVREQTAELHATTRTLADTSFAMDRAGIGIQWLEAGTGRFLYLNEAAAAMLGYTTEAMLALDLAAVYPELSAASFGTDSGGRMRLETVARTRDGKRLPVEIVAYQRPEKDGGDMRIIAFVSDVTERKVAEAALVAAKEAAEAATRARTALLGELQAGNQEMDSLAYAMSDDFHAPLLAINGFASGLAADHGELLDDEARDHLDQIIQASRQMGALLDGILGLFRSTRSGISLESLDLSGMARMTLEALACQEPGRIVRWSVEPGLAVRADRRMLELVLANLLGNAWKFTAGREDAEIRVYAGEADGTRQFCVSDNGVGFDMAYAAHLFKPFQCLHRRGEFPGLGVGLAMVQHILRRHGGRIQGEGTPGEGASFCFTLPYKPEGASTP